MFSTPFNSGTTSTNLFGGSNFGSNANNFGAQTSNPFTATGANQQTSPFPGSSFGNTSGGLFGTSSTTSGFGSTPFGGSSSFGGTTTTTPSFGTSSGFGTSNSTSAFGTPTGFGNTSTSTPFGNAGTTGFGTTSSTPGFGNTATNSGFGGTGGIFGSSAGNNTLFGGVGGESTGTTQKYDKTPDGNGSFLLAITGMPAYSQKSLEELRLEDMLLVKDGKLNLTGSGGMTPSFGTSTFSTSTSSPFGGNTGSSPFGATGTSLTGGTGLGGTNLGGTALTSSSPFGSTGGSNLFGSSNTSGTSLFGNTSFGTTTTPAQTSGFGVGGPTATPFSPSTSSFGQTTSSSPFGGATTTQPLFGASTPASGTTTSLFNTTTPSFSANPTPSLAATAFNQPTNTGSTLFGSSTPTFSSPGFGTSNQNQSATSFSLGGSTPTSFGSSTPSTFSFAGGNSNSLGNSTNTFSKPNNWGSGSSSSTPFTPTTPTFGNNSNLLFSSLGTQTAGLPAPAAFPTLTTTITSLPTAGLKSPFGDVPKLPGAILKQQQTEAEDKSKSHFNVGLKQPTMLSRTPARIAPRSVSNNSLFEKPVSEKKPGSDIFVPKHNPKDLHIDTIDTDTSSADLLFSEPRAQPKSLSITENLKNYPASELATPLHADKPPTGRNDSGIDFPRFSDSSYYCIPSLDSLRKKSASELKAVDFTIGKETIGEVHFQQPVDVRNLGELDRLVSFSPCVVDVYLNGDAPPRGKGLNVPATIRFFNCWPKVKGKISKDEPVLRKFREKLKKTVQGWGEHAHFHNYDIRRGIWEFSLDYFV